MTDFFVDLERQLIDATPRRAQRLRRARLRRLATLSTILLALVAGGAGLTVAIGGSDTGTSAGGGHAAPASTPTTLQAVPGATPRRSSYTVAVLNGTTVPGLARGVANRLQNTKFKIGNVTNAAAQDRSTTWVEYAPGRRAEADAVAETIEVGRHAIRPLSRSAKTLAGDRAAVVVLVGSDQNARAIP